MTRVKSEEEMIDMIRRAGYKAADRIGKNCPNEGDVEFLKAFLKHYVAPIITKKYRETDEDEDIEDTYFEDSITI